MSGQYYWCLKHSRVEDETGCRAADRLGPYSSAAEAERALQTAAENTEAWENDPRWNDD